jgi:multidrug resistance efflux pump
VNRLKDQNKTIDNLTAELAQQRADATQAQSKHVKWQEQLREKLATYREERKTWQTESVRIRAELSESQVALQKQKEDIALVKNE